MREVSVVLPYRNAAPTIEEAIASVLAQEGVDLELIAIDDGSTDDGPSRVARFDDLRIVRVATGGVGLVGALQRGVAIARAPLIARMDGDDVSSPDRLRRQRDVLADDETLGALGTQVEGFPAAAIGEGLRRYVAWQNAIVTPDDHVRELFVEAPLCHPSVMMRRAALEAIGGYRSGDFPEDYDLWLRLHAGGWRLAKVPQVLLRWRHVEGRATFADPRYAIARFTDVKAEHVARAVRARGRPLAVWGAGPTGKRLARALEPFGVEAELFLDIDPNKIGRPARGGRVVDALRFATHEKGSHTVVVAVGARGARDEIRGFLRGGGWVEGGDFFCAA